MRHGAGRAAVLALGVLLALLSACHTSRAAGTVEVVSGSGKVLPVAVELAVTPDSRQLGLMYRDALAAGSGMLFIFPEPAPQAFWMKNTKIPLDILFIDDTGKIVRLHARTTPFSEDSLPSDAPVPTRSIWRPASIDIVRRGIGPGRVITSVSAGTGDRRRSHHQPAPASAPPIIGPIARRTGLEPVMPSSKLPNV